MELAHCLPYVACSMTHADDRADRLGATAELLRVLGNDVRLRILLTLAGHQELCVCELVDALGRPHYAVSRDLAALQRVGLVREQRKGTWVYHSLAPEAQAEPFFRDMLRLIGDRLADAPEVQTDKGRLVRRLLLRDGDRCVVSVADPPAEAPA